MRGHLLGHKPKPFLYLPSGYKGRKKVSEEGRASTGEVSERGLVRHVEDWEGRVAAEAAPATVRIVVNPDGSLRRMSHDEMVERGYFVVGKGPQGFR